MTVYITAHLALHNQQSFNDLAKHAELDLYPAALRAAIDDVNEWVYPSINNGVYRCVICWGFDFVLKVQLCFVKVQLSFVKVQLRFVKVQLSFEDTVEF